MRNYKNICAFQVADQLVSLIYFQTKNYPRDEMFGLTSQMRRAAVSIAANIVEGARRESRKEYLRFLNISQGSLSEVEYYINLSRKLKYINDDEYNTMVELCNQTFSKLYGLIRAVSNDLLKKKSIVHSQ